MAVTDNTAAYSLLTITDWARRVPCEDSEEKIHVAKSKLPFLSKNIELTNWKSELGAYWAADDSVCLVL